MLLGRLYGIVRIRNKGRFSGLGFKLNETIKNNLYYGTIVTRTYNSGMPLVFKNCFGRMPPPPRAYAPPLRAYAAPLGRMPPPPRIARISAFWKSDFSHSWGRIRAITHDILSSKSFTVSGFSKYEVCD